MYKVFLVEDEIVVREGIRESIPWNSTEFVFAGEAPDGEMALPLIKEVKPDILITDIKMPFMDGLELSRYIKKNMPWIKIIILSGHQEFEYAKKAISIGVEEYILKPVSSRDLLELLSKVARDIENEKKQLENVQIMNKYFNDNRELMKEKFLNDLVMGTIPSHVVADKAGSFGLDIIAKLYALIRIYIEIDSDGDYDQYLYVEDIVNKIIHEKKDLIPFKRSLNEIIIILKGYEQSHLEKNCDDICSQIRDSTRLLPSTVIVEKGQIYERISGIAKSFKSILSTKNIDNVLNKYEDSLRQELHRLEENQSDLFDFDDNLILNALRYEQFESVQHILDRYFDRLKGRKISIILSIYLAVRVNLLLSNFLKELGENPDEILPKQSRIEDMATNFDTPEKLKGYMEDSIKLAYDLKERKKYNLHYDTIATAKQYIEANFTDPDISLNSVASYVNMSPCHFSTVFSQETGETFVQYLTNIRMKKAKRLLNTTSMKTGEIALEIGYKDANYFSFIFKKNVGCKPREYKNQHMQSQ